VYESVFDRAGVNSGTRYLDVGCGAGMAAQMAAARGAHVTGIDAAEGLLAIERTRTPAGDFRQGDLEELPFQDQSFDLVTGFNSIQYAGNPVMALREARRVANIDAAVAVVTWGNPENVEAAAVVAALRPFMPSPPPGAAGPFALSDEAALRQFAAATGLKPIEVFEVDSPFVYPDQETAVRGLNSSGVSAPAIQNANEQAVSEAQAIAIAQFRNADGSYCIGASFLCLLARR